MFSVSFKLGITRAVRQLSVMVMLLSVTCVAWAKAPQELYWDNLQPEGFVEIPAEFSHDSKTGQAQPNAPVIEALNGQYVKIPGFVVPLEGNDELTTEFLLVPYFGACIHVPPPPSNQIVHVKFAQGVAIDNIYDPIWVVGTLSTKGWVGDMASVGYTLAGESIAPF